MPIGIDTEKTEKFNNSKYTANHNNIFSSKEIEYISSQSDTAMICSQIVATKKAFQKAVCFDIKNQKEIEVDFKPGNKPAISLSGEVKRLCEDSGFEKFEADIVQRDGLAIACVVIHTDKYADMYRSAINKADFLLKNSIMPNDISRLLKPRKKDTHKGSYGRLLTIAGSTGLTGAAILACRSSLKCGGGLITLACAKHLNAIFESALTEVMTKPFESLGTEISANNKAEIAMEASRSDACLIGPGLGCSENTQKIIKSVVGSDCRKLIIDADGLNCIAKDMSILKNTDTKEIIITPHIGEFERLTNIDRTKILENPKELAAEFASKYNVTVVLKSHQTVIASPNGDVKTNILGNPGMATGGTGDVLAGATASFAAQGMNAFDASICAVYIHSLAADMAVQKTGEYSLTPSDILDFIPYAIKYSMGR